MLQCCTSSASKITDSKNVLKLLEKIGVDKEAVNKVRASLVAIEL